MTIKIDERLADSSRLAGATVGPRTDVVSPPIPEAAPAAKAPYNDGWLRGIPPYVHPQTTSLPWIIAVGGGKGGVGKSLVSANLAAKLAHAGRRVLAIDLDLGGANLHTYFGVTLPRFGATDLLKGDVPIQDLVVQTPVHGVSLVTAGANDHDSWLGGDLSANDFCRITKFITEARTALAADVVLIDLGAGSHRHTLDFFSLAHVAMLTVLPEPTSIENAYVFLKAWLFHTIDSVAYRLGAPRAGDQLKTFLAQTQAGRNTGYADKLRHVPTSLLPLAHALTLALAGRKLGVIVNQARCQKDIDLGKSVEVITSRYFGFDSQAIGYLNYDETALKALRSRHLLAADFPHSLLARRMGDVARVTLNLIGA